MRFVFPQGKKKALTFSYDDGQIFDRKLVEIFNKYSLKGTFHLNSGTLGEDRSYEAFITKEEVSQLFKGHEVAVHGVQHRNLPTLTKQQMLLELLEDRKALEALTGYMVQGMSYAFGSYSDEIIQMAKTVGIKYSRTVNSTNGFFPPADFMAWHPTCHHDGNLMQLGEQFLEVPDFIELPIMYVWGHSFEFGRKDDYSVIEEFAQLVNGKEDIWYATNIEICEYIQATRNQEFSADGLTMKNPTAVSVWVSTEAGLTEVKPGECKYLGEH
ncbi:MAG: polysaccharide deacetylase family protein [Lachnospiraceae bacterium]|nr:polysaccharide deacetylase family protein [Lachnospiraceae bacterium]